MNAATSQALQASRALRGRLAAALRSSETGLTSLGRIPDADRALLDAELALVGEAQRLLLKPCRGLS
jgi:hypothetical protein